jgi:hypothetical protein
MTQLYRRWAPAAPARYPRRSHLCYPRCRAAGLKSDAVTQSRSVQLPPAVSGCSTAAFPSTSLHPEGPRPTTGQPERSSRTRARLEDAGDRTRRLHNLRGLVIDQVPSTRPWPTRSTRATTSSCLGCSSRPVVVFPEQTSSSDHAYDPGFSGETRVATVTLAAVPAGHRKVVARAPSARSRTATCVKPRDGIAERARRAVAAMELLEPGTLTNSSLRGSLPAGHLRVPRPDERSSTRPASSTSTTARARRDLLLVSPRSTGITQLNVSAFGDAA